MRDTKPRAQTTAEEPKAAPYFGLGFEMQGVIERSRRMALRRARSKDARTDERRLAGHGS